MGSLNSDISLSIIRTGWRSKWHVYCSIYAPKKRRQQVLGPRNATFSSLTFIHSGVRITRIFIAHVNSNLWWRSSMVREWLTVVCLTILLLFYYRCVTEAVLQLEAHGFQTGWQSWAFERSGIQGNIASLSEGVGRGSQYFPGFLASTMS